MRSILGVVHAWCWVGRCELPPRVVARCAVRTPEETVFPLTPHFLFWLCLDALWSEIGIVFWECFSDIVHSEHSCEQTTLNANSKTINTAFLEKANDYIPVSPLRGHDEICCCKSSPAKPTERGKLHTHLLLLVAPVDPRFLPASECFHFFDFLQAGNRNF